MKYELAVIGDAASVIAFRGLGFTVVALNDPSHAERELYRLIDSKKYAVIYITEPMAKACEHILNRYASEPVPAIIPIPASQGSDAYAITNLKSSVMRAVGFDILSTKEESGE